MPITAKLSRQFYEKLGDEVTNELVTWLNAVDDSYRQEFRELFDANFGQVRAEMAQLRAELRGEMAQLRAELRGEMAQLSAELRGEMAQLRADLRGQMSGLATELRSDMNRLRDELTVRLKSQEVRLIRWMVGLWLSSMLALAALMWSRLV